MNKQFIYTAIDENGNKITGTFKGSREDLIQFIKEHNLFLLSIKEHHIKGRLSKHYSEDDFLNDLESIKFLIDSGLTIDQAVTTLISSDTPESQRSVFWTKVLNQIKAGHEFSTSLKNSLARTNTNLNQISSYITLLEVSEKMANLPKGIEQLVKILEFKKNTKKRIREVLAYPMFLLTMSIIVLIIILIFILPQFAELLNMNKLPLLTALIFKISLWAKQEKFLLLLGILVFSTIIWLMRKLILGLLMKLPILKNIYRYWSLSHLFYLLSLSLQANIDIAKSIKFLNNISIDKRLKPIISQIENALRQGKSFSEAVSYIDLLPLEAKTIITSAEKSNTLELALSKLAQRYEEIFFEKLKRFITYLEPTILIIIGLIIGIIVITIMLAVVSTSDILG